jgi:ubiquinone/menaquinone biosynthesis C-methylase UbiE
MPKGFDLSPEAARTYDTKKVPAVFGPLAEASLAQIDLHGVGSVLDVACGSGIVVRVLAGQLPQSARIVGADLSAAMIEVAKTHSSTEGRQIDWVVAPADAIPMADASFDLVTCQQGLQFFPDRPAALSEMFRLLRPGGRLALTCWAGIPQLFSTIAKHLAARVSDQAARVAVEPFGFSDADAIAALIRAAGFSVAPAVRIEVTRRIPATVAAISAELLATPNETALKTLSEDTFLALAKAILHDLREFSTGEQLALPQSSLLFHATRPAPQTKGQTE